MTTTTLPGSDAWYRRRTDDIDAEKQARAYAAWEALSQPVAAKPKAYPRLVGKAGFPAAVAAGVNVITGAPNSAAEIEIPKRGRATVRRGPGDALTFAAPVVGEGTARLVPPSGLQEVRVDQVRARKRGPIRIPEGGRIFNTHDGRLFWELGSGLPLLPKGPREIR